MVRIMCQDEVGVLNGMLATKGVQHTAVGWPTSETFVAVDNGDRVGLFTVLLPHSGQHPILIHFMIDQDKRISRYACELVGVVKALCRSRGWVRLTIPSTGDVRVDRFIGRKFDVQQRWQAKRGRNYYLVRIV